MKACPICRTLNKDENAFCKSCGSKIEEKVVFCSYCGRKVLSTNKFCKSCGKEIKSPASFAINYKIKEPPPVSVSKITSVNTPASSNQKKSKKKSIIILSTVLPLSFIFLAVILFTFISIFPFSTGTVAADSVKKLDLGVAEVKDPDPEMMIESEVLGLVPANQVGIILAEGLTRSDAQNIADELGASIVGEIEFINFYQLETKDITEGELIASLDMASKLEGVELAFPNGAVFPQATTEGNSCSPLNDPLYTEGNSRPYEMIGVQNAWDIIKASGVKLNKVRVGIIDTEIYTKSDNGFSPELYFPDKKGKYPKGKVQIVPLDKKNDLTNMPVTDMSTGDLISGGLSHCTQMAHIVGADYEGSGPAGVSSILGGKQSIIVTNAFKYLKEGTSTPAVKINKKDITQYMGNTYNLLVNLKKQVENNVKVINLSLGNKTVGAINATECQAYKLFFEKMNKDYPDVVFVAAAGNNGQGVNGTNFGPGGISVPNVITVGALDQDGDRAKADDWGYDEKDLKKWYQKRLNDGSIPKNTTYQGYIDLLDVGSNYATGNGEVTLSAVGTGIPVGLDPKSKAVTSNGTSVAAPQVTGAIALIQSINPKLSAAQIKKILTDTKAPEVERDGKIVTVPANMGGGILRVDDAVLKVINDMRKAKDENAVELKKEDLMAMGSIKLTASGGPEEYIITASVSAVGPGRTSIRIETSGNGVLKGSKTQSISAPGEVSWKLTKMSDGGTIKVFRSDTGGCAFLTIAKFEPDYTQDIPDLTPDNVLPDELKLKGTITIIWDNVSHPMPLTLNINFKTQEVTGTFTYSGPGPIGESVLMGENDRVLDSVQYNSQTTINGTINGQIHFDEDLWLRGEYTWDETRVYEEDPWSGEGRTDTFHPTGVIWGTLDKNNNATGRISNPGSDWTASPQ